MICPHCGTTILDINIDKSIKYSYLYPEIIVGDDNKKSDEFYLPWAY